VLDPSANLATKRWAFRLIHKDKGKSAKPKDWTVLEARSAIPRWQRDGYNVFVTVNEFGPEKQKTEEYLRRVRALYCDCDTPEQVQGVEKLIDDGALPQPTMIVESSSGKKHFYWALDDYVLPTQDVADLQSVLVRKLGADGDAKDLTRILRVPDTLNLKGEPQLCRLLKSDGPRHTLDELREAIDALPEPPPKPAGSGAQRVESATNILPFPPRALTAEAKAEIDAANDELATGIEREWFEVLPDVDKNGALKQMLDVCSDLATGGRDGWIKTLMAAARSCAPNAEALAREWSAQDARHTDAEFDTQWESLGDRDGGVTVGSLVAMASERGFDNQAWAKYAEQHRATQDGGDELDGNASAVGGSGAALAAPSGPPSTALPVKGALQRPLSPSEAVAKAVGHLLGAAKPVSPGAPIPHRPFLLGPYIFRNEATILAAPGGRAKTALAIAWACSLSSGKNLVGAHVHGAPKRVVFVSAEEDGTELQRRFEAARIMHNLTPSDLANITVIGSEGVRFTLTGGTERAPAVNHTGLGALAELMREKEADVLILDPLGPLVPLGLNDNGLMASLLLGLKQIAKAGNFAPLILHHFKKGADGSAESIGGAAAIVNHARAALTIQSIDKETAENRGVLPSEEWRWLRVVSLKANLTPPADADDWLYLASVELPNAAPPDYPRGDNVQAIVKPPGGPAPAHVNPNTDAMIDEEIVRQVRKAKAAGVLWRSSARGGVDAPVAAKEIARIVAKVRGLNPKDAKRVAETKLRDLLTRSVLAKDEVKDKHRKPRLCVVPGPNAPAEDAP
jgi:AAA domain/Primase C terminal 2 (PriCT-2)/RepB DNA-primase from phage plasmid